MPQTPARKHLLAVVGAVVAIAAGSDVVTWAVVEQTEPSYPDTGTLTVANAETLGAIAPPIVVQQGQWKCNGPQDHSIVIVQDPVNVKKDPPEPYSAAVNLQDGCTGTIAALIVMGNQRDGIKVGGTARNVEILSGYVGCGPRAGTVHQDGVQAGGGTSVHFHNLHVDCPQSNNAGMFVNQTNGGSGIRPTDITCTDCDLLSANNALNVGEDSIDSGARYSILRKGTGGSAPATCKRVNGATPVDADNVCVDPNPAIDTGEPLSP
jgi:hypothetical protein